MAIGTKERTELRAELISQGYAWKYIDEWQPKVTLYRHRAMYSPSGEIVSPVGTAVRNLPGSPDYVSRKAKIGLFIWQPGQGCQCRWCVELHTASNQPSEATEATESAVAETPDDAVLRGKGTRQMGPYFKPS